MIARKLFQQKGHFSLFSNRYFTMSSQQKTVVIVGGGLAGLTAAIEAHDQGNVKVILVEKEKNIGLISKIIPQEKYAAAYMVLTDEAVEGFGKSTLGFYASKGFFTQVKGVDGLAKLMDVDEKDIKKEFEEYDRHVESKTLDAYGKSVFPGRLLVPDTTYWVALITPVVHYTMGGLNMNVDAAILDEDASSVIPGLYGAGEVTGGVHGHNRLAGNSLLECVVFGRTAGRNAAIFAKSQ
ncbi:hypothetical protein K501DRAFT_268344 [Backusella circina FSU 941]|nr:hypothetical protein K501DRAFT_268344 [Backusella circina FSU 941]